MPCHPLALPTKSKAFSFRDPAAGLSPIAFSPSSIGFSVLFAKLWPRLRTRLRHAYERH
jgi:hypothetical protein